MAIALVKTSKGRVRAQPLTAQTADADGEWIDIDALDDWSVHVENLAGPGIVTLSVSNKPSKPADADDEITLATLNADGGHINSAKWRWLKVHKSTGGGGATDAYLSGSFGSYR